MKQIVIGFGFFMIFILSVASVMALIKDNVEHTKLTQAVELAIYQSLQEGVEKEQDPGLLFEENITEILGDEILNIEVVASDYEKGILKASVEMSYVNMGRNRTVTAVRTVIYERTIG